MPNDQSTDAVWETITHPVLAGKSTRSEKQLAELAESVTSPMGSPKQNNRVVIAIIALFVLFLIVIIADVSEDNKQNWFKREGDDKQDPDGSSSCEPDTNTAFNLFCSMLFNVSSMLGLASDNPVLSDAQAQDVSTAVVDTTYYADENGGNTSLAMLVSLAQRCGADVAALVCYAGQYPQGLVALRLATLAPIQAPTALPSAIPSIAPIPAPTADPTIEPSTFTSITTLTATSTTSTHTSTITPITQNFNCSVFDITEGNFGPLTSFLANAPANTEVVRFNAGNLSVCFAGNGSCLSDPTSVLYSQSSQYVIRPSEFFYGQASAAIQLTGLNLRQTANCPITVIPVAGSFNVTPSFVPVSGASLITPTTITINGQVVYEHTGESVIFNVTASNGATVSGSQISQIGSQDVLTPVSAGSRVDNISFELAFQGPGSYFIFLHPEQHFGANAPLTNFSQHDIAVFATP